MVTLKLKYGLKINGETIKELTCDPENFTGHDYLNAVKLLPKDASAQEVGFTLGAHAVIASNRGKGWTPDDFKNLRGTDVVKFISFAGDFFTDADEAQEGESSGDATAPTPSGSTYPSKS